MSFSSFVKVVVMARKKESVLRLEEINTKTEK